LANVQLARIILLLLLQQEAIRESDIDELLMGMASQIAEREDHIVTPDLHGSFHGPLEFSRRDLMAVNIQRGRDHGLPDYNTARVFYGLPRVERFEDINNSREPPSLREVCSTDKQSATVTHTHTHTHTHTQREREREREREESILAYFTSSPFITIPPEDVSASAMSTT